MAHITVEVTERGSFETGRLVTFRGVVTGVDQATLDARKVCLARTPFAKGSDPDGNPRCSFALNKLHEHGGHTPPMRSQGALEDYIDRVRDAIEEAWGAVENNPVTYVLFEA